MEMSSCASKPRILTAPSALRVMAPLEPSASSSPELAFVCEQAWVQRRGAYMAGWSQPLLSCSRQEPVLAFHFFPHQALDQHLDARAFLPDGAEFFFCEDVVPRQFFRHERARFTGQADALRFASEGGEHLGQAFTGAPWPTFGHCETRSVRYQSRRPAAMSGIVSDLARGFHDRAS
jgi:hypothetical protein